MVAEKKKKSTKGICPTCHAPGVPEGMHCRSCLCDILCDEPIGTFKKIYLASRRQKRTRPLPFRSMAELYA